VTLRRIEATRYVTPLREGGSLPALVEASDDGVYGLKYHGRGQGRKALVAEVVAGELARSLGFHVPELTLTDVGPALGQAEPDAEIQDLLRASVGVNLGVDFLPSALPFSPAASGAPPPELAAEVVWFDALVTNVDRTAKNPNLLEWHGNLWLIDHGAALYFHHGDRRPGHERTAFPPIAEHVLLPFAGSVEAADERLASRVTEAVVTAAVEAVPDDWLGGDNRGIYVEYILGRLAEPRAFVAEAERARERS
jgi:hypothetical protein